MQDLPYEAWLSRLRQLADLEDCAALVSREPNAHRAAYEQGLTPDQELSELKDMGQWRGCGCGS